MAELTSDVRTLLDREPFTASAVADLREALGRDPSRYRTLRDAVAVIRDRHKANPVPDASLRIGVGEVLMGRYQHGLDHLNRAGDNGLGLFHKGLAYQNIQRWDDAAAAFAAAAAAGHEPRVSELHRVGALRRAGRVEEARALLDTLETGSGGTAEYHFQLGSLLTLEGDITGAVSEFEKAIASDRQHTGALFELAYYNDLNGNDGEALEYYRECLKRPPVPMAALINLGVLYEDRMEFREAEKCYRQVLSFDPNQPRARLFFRDCRASRDMYYDENLERDNLAKGKLMEIPVTDFELSVRSRNCLRKMNIRTLGDLTRTTEAALLASKNFGETSLAEIKEMMQSKGLWLGLALEGGQQHAAAAGLGGSGGGGGGGGGGGMGGHDSGHTEMSQEERAMMARTISELNLSVRARKCMTKLGCQTVGELLSYTGDQLLECKNFGVTSLNEVREKLAELNLKLKNE
ncbi:DNA-directed RNA polymerase subunit alpha C-terminal domain-containing protein [Isosphaeraceae bacterium EP7]